MFRFICPDSKIKKTLLSIMGLCYRQIYQTLPLRFSMSLGARLTRLRLTNGESLQQVADAVGVSKAHIWELEKGRTDNPSMALVTRLADHFGISLAALVGEDPMANDANAQIARMFRQAGELAPDDLALLNDMMQTLLKRRRKSG
jgi:transcriptional regulator with XRE-family HTH domain